MSTETLQTRIKRLRKEKGFTLDELADETGSSKAYMWELENKPAIRPSARKIMGLATALDTTVDYLMDGYAGQSADEKVLIRTYRKLPPKMQNKAVRILKVLIENLSINE